MSEAKELNTNARVDEDYKAEWEKMHGNGEEEEPTPPEEEKEKELEQEEEPSQEEEESEEQEEEEAPSEKETPEKKAAPSKDDEYQAFIDSQPTEELKERAKKLIQGLRTADGRASSLHRQLNERERMLQQVYQQRSEAALSQERKAPTSARPDEAQAKPRELPDKVKALKERSPQAAEIIEEIAKYHSEATKEELERILDERLGRIEQEKQVQSQAAELERLEERSEKLFGKYGMSASDVVRSEDFAYWLRKKQAEEPGIVKLYQTAQDADTAYLILEKYEKEYQEELARVESEERATTKSKSPDADPTKGDELRETRKERLKKAVTPKSSRATSPKRSLENLSEKEEFELLWGKDGIYRKKSPIFTQQGP